MSRNRCCRTCTTKFKCLNKIPFEKSKNSAESLFVRRLVGILEERGLSIRSFSAEMGVSHTSLSRIISGDIAISPQMVALVCSALDGGAEAAGLMEAFLLDELQEITRSLPKNTSWAQKLIVTVSTKPSPK